MISTLRSAHLACRRSIRRRTSMRSCATTPSGTIIRFRPSTSTGELTPLPLLQFTLSQLWAARDRNRVTSDVYRQVGRPRDALRRTVDKVSSCLSPDELNVAKREWEYCKLSGRY